MSAMVLVADDDATIRFMLKGFLEGKGLRVLEAEEGGAAFQVAARERPALVIMDINMPNIHGGLAVHVLRESKETADIKVSAMLGGKPCT